MYKKLSNINFDSFFTIVADKRTRGHSATISVKFTKHNYRKYFFTASIISFWNKLPQRAIDSNSVNEFKYHINSFFQENNIW